MSDYFEDFLMYKKAQGNCKNTENQYRYHFKMFLKYSNIILDAKYILEYIKNNEIYYFKTRDILRNRRRFKTNRECEQGLKILVDRGYIYQLPEYYVVNPLIFK